MERMLEGTSVVSLLLDKKKRETLVGKRVRYLRKIDIDYSGRGYFFPRYGDVMGFQRREVAMDHPHNFCMSIGDVVEMVLAEGETTEGLALV